MTAAVTKPARQAVNFTASAAGGFPPYTYEWLSFGETAPAIPGISDLYGHWPLDETGGTRVATLGSGVATADLSEVGGAVGTMAGRFGLAMSTVEPDARGLRGTITGLDATNGLTVACWFYPASGYNLNRARLLALWDGGGGGPAGPYLNIERWYNSSKLDAQLVLTGGQCVFGLGNHPGPYELDKWHLLVMSLDPATKLMRCDIDNGEFVFFSATTWGNGDLASLSPDTLNVGAPHSGGDGWRGGIDSVMLWSRVLTASERRMLYDGRSLDQNPAYYYKEAGIYTAQCRAVDSYGNSEIETIDVTITDPVAVVEGNVTWTWRGVVEPPIPWEGATVELYTGVSPAGVLADTTTTDASGNYSFSGVTAGDVYVLLPAGQKPAAYPGAPANSGNTQAAGTAALGVTLTLDLAEMVGGT